MLTTATSVPGRQRLAALIERAAKLRGLRGLTEEELLEFGRLYRRAASELSHARAYGANSADLEQLNWLVGRAYGMLYVTESTGFSGVRRFFAAELPQTFRRHLRLFLVCTALFLVPALLAAVLTLLRPDLLEMISPELSTSLRDLALRHA